MLKFAGGRDARYGICVSVIFVRYLYTDFGQAAACQRGQSFVGLYLAAVSPSRCGYQPGPNSVPDTQQVGIRTYRMPAFRMRQIGVREAKYWRSLCSLRRFSNQPVAEIVQCGEPILSGLFR